MDRFGARVVAGADGCDGAAGNASEQGDGKQNTASVRRQGAAQTRRISVTKS